MRGLRFAAGLSVLVLGLVTPMWAATVVPIAPTTWAVTQLTGKAAHFNAAASIGVSIGAGAHAMEGWSALLPYYGNTLIPNEPLPSNPRLSLRDLYCGEVNVHGQSDMIETEVMALEGLLIGDKRSATGGTATFANKVVDGIVVLARGKTEQRYGTFEPYPDAKNVRWKYVVRSAQGSGGGPWTDFEQVL